MILYHVTPTENINSIKENGLIPQIGERSMELGETKEAVYLFPTMESVDNALVNWLGECLEDIEEVSLLTVNCPNNIEFDSCVEYERVYYDTIPFNWIESVEAI